MGLLVGISTRTPTTSICLTAAPSSSAPARCSLSGSAYWHSRLFRQAFPLSTYTRNRACPARTGSARPASRRPPIRPVTRSRPRCPGRCRARRWSAAAAGALGRPPAARPRSACPRPARGAAAAPASAQSARCAPASSRAPAPRCRRIGATRLSIMVALALRRGAHRPQVARLHAESRQRLGRPGDLQRLRRVLPARSAGPGRRSPARSAAHRSAPPLHQLPPAQRLPARLARAGLRERGGRLAAVRPAASLPARPSPRLGRGPAGVLILPGQPFLDHPQRQVLVALGGEDDPQPVHVAGRRTGGSPDGERAGAIRPSVSRNLILDTLMSGKSGRSCGEDLADAEVAAGRLVLIPRPASLRRTRAARPDPAGRRAGTCPPAPRRLRSAGLPRSARG